MRAPQHTHVRNLCHFLETSRTISAEASPPSLSIQHPALGKLSGGWQSLNCNVKGCLLTCCKGSPLRSVLSVHVSSSDWFWVGHACMPCFSLSWSVRDVTERAAARVHWIWRSPVNTVERSVSTYAMMQYFCTASPPFHRNVIIGAGLPLAPDELRRVLA